MKRTIIPLFAFALALPAMALEPQADSTGLPGDDFSLQGALDLFKRNIEMEKFEEELNTDSTHVNNLDLDGNGETDYVRVETQREGDAVYVVMKVAVSATESQDVAVIGIEKTGEESATLQIIGDEDLYPANTIVEPFAEEEKATPSKGPNAPPLVSVRVVVNVWSWRPVPWCFSARYYPYSSAWYWGHYPGWWRPWRPHPWRAWYGWGHHHHMWYRPWNSCRVVHARAVYAPRRARSVAVQGRYHDAHQRHAKAKPSGRNEVKPEKKSSPKATRSGKTPSSKGAPKPARKGARPGKGGGKKP
jgi:hypothetical protein